MSTLNKEQIVSIIDKENGVNFSYNISVNGYIFKKNGSFMIFEMKEIQNVYVAHIKYIHISNKRSALKDIRTIFAYACNFWMVQRFS